MLKRALALALLLSVALPASALAYFDVGTDPEEGMANDIRASWRWVGMTEVGPRVAFGVRTYESVARGYDFHIILDSDAGPRPDFEVHVQDAPTPDCDVYQYTTEVRVGDAYCGRTKPSPISGRGSASITFGPTSASDGG
jgi:hypothetical protein